MRHGPARGTIVIMLRSLKMHAMSQAVSNLLEQGAPAFDGVPELIVASRLDARTV